MANSRFNKNFCLQMYVFLSLTIHSMIYILILFFLFLQQGSFTQNMSMKQITGVNKDISKHKISTAQHGFG